MRYDLKIASMVWSYSRLTAFEDCPYAWFLRYIYESKSRSKFFAQYGSLIHGLLQAYLEGKIAVKDLTHHFLTGFLTKVTAKAPNSNIFVKYLNQGRSYFSDFTFPQRKIIAVEEKLEFEFAGYPFIGFMDLISEDADGKLYITDHKSRALSPRSHRKKPTQSDKELDEYLRQLYVYSAGVFQKYGRWPDYLEFNCFRTGVWITEPFIPERMSEVEAWAGETIERIIRCSSWPANRDFWFCKNLCDVSQDCEYEEEFS